MLDTGGVTHTLTLVTESKINILFENRSESYTEEWTSKGRGRKGVNQLPFPKDETYTMVGGVWGATPPNNCS